MAKKLGSLILDLITNTSQFKKGLDDANKKTKKFKSDQSRVLKDLSKSWKSLSGAIAGLALVKTLTSYGTAAIQLGSRLDDMAKAAGVTTDTLQGLEYAARQTGVRTEVVGELLLGLNRRVGEAALGTGELVNILKQFNFQLRNQDGSLKSTNTLLYEFSDLIANANSEQEAIAISSKAFGEQGSKYITVLKGGSKGLEEWISKAKEANQVMDTETITALAKAENAIESFKIATTIVVGEAIAYWSDALNTVKDYNTEVLKSTKQKIELISQPTVELKSTPFEYFKKLRQSLNEAGGDIGKVDILQESIITFSNDVASAVSKLEEQATRIESAREQIRKATSYSGRYTFLGNQAAANVKRDEYSIIQSEIERLQTLREFAESTLKFIGKKLDVAIAGGKLDVSQTSITGADVVANTIAEQIAKELQNKQAGKLLDSYFQSIDAQSLTTIFGRNTELGYQSEIAKLTKDTEGYVSILKEQQKVQDQLAEYYLNADEMENYWKAIKEGISIGNELDEISNKLNSMQEAVVSFGDELTQAFVNAAADGKFAFSDLADYVLAQIIKMAVQSAIIAPLFGSGQNGETLGLITSAFSGIKGYADGGRPPAGKVSVVGEEGPELFVPSVASGQIVPMSELGGMGGTVYVDARGADVAAVQRLERAFANLNATVEMRALTSVQDVYGRTPNYLRR